MVSASKAETMPDLVLTTESKPDQWPVPSEAEGESLPSPASNPSCALSGCVTLGRSLGLSEAQLPTGK